MPFLDLPIELRRQIYGYMAIPATDPFSVYYGLYLSCHQIKNEVDLECGKILDKHLHSVRSALGIHFSLPETFPEKHHLHIQFRAEQFKTDPSRFLCIPEPADKDAMSALLSLRIESLHFSIIPRRTDEEQLPRAAYLATQDLLSWIFKKILKREMHSRYIVVDMTALREEQDAQPATRQESSSSKVERQYSSRQIVDSRGKAKLVLERRDDYEDVLDVRTANPCTAYTDLFADSGLILAGPMLHSQSVWVTLG